MRVILTVDRLEVLVLVDNVTDSLSTNSGVVISEWSGLLSAGRLQLLSGRCTCCAHHGLSLLITERSGSARHTVLFDAGPEASTFLRNAEFWASILPRSIQWCYPTATGTTGAALWQRSRRSPRRGTDRESIASYTRACWHRERPDSRAFGFPIGSALRRYGRAAPVRRDGKRHPGNCRRSPAVRVEVITGSICS